MLIMKPTYYETDIPNLKCISKYVLYHRCNREQLNITHVGIIPKKTTAPHPTLAEHLFSIQNPKSRLG